MSNVINPFNGSDDEYNDYLDHLERKMMEEQEPQEMPEDFQMVATAPTFPSTDYIMQRLDEQNDPNFQKTMDVVAKVLERNGTFERLIDWHEKQKAKM